MRRIFSTVIRPPLAPNKKKLLNAHRRPGVITLLRQGLVGELHHHRELLLYRKSTNAQNQTQDEHRRQPACVAGEVISGLSKLVMAKTQNGHLLALFPEGGQYH
jgi:hypothetical protein